MIGRATRLMTRVRDLMIGMKFYTGGRVVDTSSAKQRLATDGLNFSVARDAEEIGDVLARTGYASEWRDRLVHGDVLVYLHSEEGAIVTLGWKTRREQFWISEIGWTVSSAGREIFYDFNTPPAFRMKGYHSALLTMTFASLAAGQVGLVFALTDNHGPHKAYRRLALKRESVVTMLLGGKLLPYRTRSA